ILVFKVMLLLCHSHTYLKAYPSKLELRACEGLVSRKITKVYEEEPLFQLFFLKNDEDQSVEIEEVEEIDFTEVKKHIERGESVFITRKRGEKLAASLVAEENAAGLWYLSRI
ncbi:MAG: hypothetical protein OEX06_06035, partial [Candidatus Bathyarchaeota archaeon]|nr:hypothetical protein [Candidatus Bathyarchaeota archaeon]